MERKICRKCNIEKELSEFPKNRKTCKICTSIYLKNWKIKNNDRIKQQQKIRDSKRLSQPKEKERQQKYYRDNKNKILENTKISKQRKRSSDIIFKLTDNIRSRLRQFLKTKRITKNNKTFEIVGCSPTDLKEHLEKQFKIGMSWENHGLFGWHIDHIIPLSSAKTEEELYKLCHYTNLQPLWSKDNLKKSNKLDYLY